MTEASHQMTSNPLPPGKRKPGSVGIGHGVDVRILDQEGTEVAQGKEGEICIKGENVTKGYLNNPEANKTSYTSTGFFRTGDQGKVDEEGYVIITGRIKELINKGGEKISPIELDNVIAHHPSVGEAVSFAMEDELYGQDVGVAVVLKQGGKDLSTEELRKWMSDKVAKFKLPKKVSTAILFCGGVVVVGCCANLSQVYVTDVMPKTATGKIQRRQVAAAMLAKDKDGPVKAKL